MALSPQVDSSPLQGCATACTAASAALRAQMHGSCKKKVTSNSLLQIPVYLCMRKSVRGCDRFQTGGCRCTHVGVSVDGKAGANILHIKACMCRPTVCGGICNAGFGNMLARPLFREKHNPSMSESEAEALIHEALKVGGTCISGQHICA